MVMPSLAPARLAAVLAVLHVFLPAGTVAQATPPPCLSQLQVLGSHNSYHLPPPSPIIDLLSSGLAKATLPPTAFLPQAWQYQHPSLATQLDAGIRAMELDVHPDPDGGLYASPAFLKFAGATTTTLADPSLKQPGFKVLHIPDIDFQSSCTTYVACLAEVKAWSEAHPSHVPITLITEVSFGESELVRLLGPEAVDLVNSQLAALATSPGPSALVSPPDVSSDLLGALEAEILSVFPREALITPDSVRAAVGLDQGADIADHLLQPPSSPCPWPDLDSLRGKVLVGFILPSSDAVELYSKLHPGQNGAVAFMVWDSFPVPGAVLATAGATLNLDANVTAVPPVVAPSAAAQVRQLTADVEERVAGGYLVRARADANTVEARAGYAARAQAVLASPAHVVATDYTSVSVPVGPDPPQYVVRLPGGQPARCINGAPEGSSGAEVACSAAAADAEAPPIVGAARAPAAGVGGARAMGAVPPPAGVDKTQADVPPPATAGSAAAAAPPLATDGAAGAGVPLPPLQPPPLPVQAANAPPPPPPLLPLMSAPASSSATARAFLGWKRAVSSLCAVAAAAAALPW